MIPIRVIALTILFSQYFVFHLKRTEKKQKQKKKRQEQQVLLIF